MKIFFKNDAKQIFYFDDFLGSNFLNALNRHEDSHIANFIKRISKDKKKRFILTSRTTVLNRGKTLTEQFKLINLKNNEFELEVKSLTEIDKAKILHSCLWFSRLSRDYFDVIVRDRHYWQIIKHNNFNPRLISFITDPARLPDILPEIYWAYIEKTLQNLIDIWEHVFNNQLTDWSRAIVRLVVLAGNVLEEKHLRECYESLSLNLMAQNYTGDSDFDMCMRLLVGSVLNRSVEYGVVKLTLFNPSIADYVLRKTATAQSTLTSHLIALDDLKSLNTFLQLIQNGIVDFYIGRSVVESLCKIKLSERVQLSKVRYHLKLCEAAIQKVDDASALCAVREYVEAFSSCSQCSSHLAEAAPTIIYFLKNSLIPIEVIARFLAPVNANDLAHADIDAIVQIIPFLTKSVADQFVDELRPAIVDFWQTYIQSEIVERDILCDFYDANDIGYAEYLVKKMLDEIFNEYGIEFDYSDRSAVLEYVDISEIINGNIERSMNESSDDGRVGFVDRDANEIDDLFSFDMPSN